MRVLSALFALALLTGCDAFSTDDGSFDLQATGDATFSQTGTARLAHADGRVVVTLVRDDGPVALRFEWADGDVATGSAGVSRVSALDVRVPVILTDDRVGVSGTVTFTAVADDEVAGSFDVGLATYGDVAARTVQGTFRAVR